MTEESKAAPKEANRRSLRFSLRTYLLASVLIGAIGAPLAYEQYLYWQRETALIQIQYVAASEMAEMIRFLYESPAEANSTSTYPIRLRGDLDNIEIEVEARLNALIVRAPAETMLEVKQVIAAIDSNSTAPPNPPAALNDPPSAAEIEAALQRFLEE
ncbi:MAG: secretin N-terminal domain-containing protein [Pirellulaceae bacterium]|jgi:hypothetical protein|nr:secretin N-terminal domain-containing protein [Pirellulaceae bacterium]MDP7019182.1 secretin N-terminal domain-containing protein [Pirellulaceae bacterium]